LTPIKKPGSAFNVRRKQGITGLFNGLLLLQIKLNGDWPW